MISILFRNGDGDGNGDVEIQHIKISKPNHVKWVDHKCQNWLLNNKYIKSSKRNEYIKCI